MKTAARYTTDEVTVCDCCGRSGLQKTVAMVAIQEDGTDGEICGYFGRTCAARGRGVSVKVIDSELKAATVARRAAADSKRADDKAALWASVGEKASMVVDSGVAYFEALAKIGGISAL